MRKRLITKIKITLAIFVAVFIASYTFYESRNLILGPRISITSPLNGTSLREPLVVIRGEAKNISKITLNDRQIFVDGNGIFEEKLALPAGYTIMKVVVEDKFGRKKEKTIEMVLSESKNNVAIR